MMQKNELKKLSRRELLTGAGALAAALTLEGCGPEDVDDILNRAPEGPIGKKLLEAQRGAIRENYREFVLLFLENPETQIRDKRLTDILQKRERILSDPAFKEELILDVLRSGLHKEKSPSATSLVRALELLLGKDAALLDGEELARKAGPLLSRIKIRVNYAYSAKNKEITFDGPYFDLVPARRR